MNRQSMTGYFISKLSLYIRQSATCTVAVMFFEYIKRLFLSSILYGVLSFVIGQIKKEYDASFLKRFICGKSIVQRAYEKSFLCFVLCTLFNVLSYALAKVFNIFKKIFDGSFSYGVFLNLSGKTVFSYSNLLSLFISLMIICPHEAWNNLYGVIAAFAFLAYFMSMCGRKIANASFKDEGFGIVVFTLFAAFSVTYAYDKADALRIVLFLVAAVIFGFLIRNAVDNKEKLYSFLKIIAFGAFVTSVIGIVQRFMGIEVNPEYVDVAVNRSMPGRVFSTFANPNNFAELLVLTMPFTAALVFSVKSFREKILYIAFLLTDFVAIGMSYSRSCWVALLIAAIVMLLVYDWRLLVPCAILGIMLIPFLPESITDRILTIGSMKDTSNASRLIIWRGAWKMIQNYFVSGVGAGPVTFAKYYLPLADHWALTAPHSHMVYMELIIEFGIFAFIGFMMYMIFVMKKAFCAVVYADKGIRAILGAIIGSMCGMAFVFSVEYVWFYPRVMFMFFITLGLLLAAAKLANPER